MNRVHRRYALELLITFVLYLIVLVGSIKLLGIYGDTQTIDISLASSLYCRQQLSSPPRLSGSSGALMSLNSVCTWKDLPSRSGPAV